MSFDRLMRILIGIIAAVALSISTVGAAYAQEEVVDPEDDGVGALQLAECMVGTGVAGVAVSLLSPWNPVEACAEIGGAAIDAAGRRLAEPGIEAFQGAVDSANDALAAGADSAAGLASETFKGFIDYSWAHYKQAIVSFFKVLKFSQRSRNDILNFLIALFTVMFDCTIDGFSYCPE